MKKLNKKGFTLVELLAVIAILAILMLLVTPNILNMFKEGKKSAFVTQAQSIYKAAETKYISESIKNPGSFTFTNAVDGGTTLDVEGSDAVKYCVKVDANGKVKKFAISDNSYVISLPASGTGNVSIDSISEKYDSGDNKGDYKNLSDVTASTKVTTCE